MLPPAPAGQTFVAATATDPNGNTSEFSTSVSVDPAQSSADLAVSMDVAPSQVEPGSNVTYAITVTNNGPTAADNVTLSTGVPASTTFVSFTAPSGWTTSTPAAGGEGNVTGSVAWLDQGESATMTFVVHVNDNTPRATAVSAIASVTSDTADPNTSNNTIFVTAAVPGSITETDLAIAASVVPESVPQGQPLTFAFIGFQPRANRRHQRDLGPGNTESDDIPVDGRSQRVDHSDSFRGWYRHPQSIDPEYRRGSFGRLHGHRECQFNRHGREHHHRRGHNRERDD